MRTSEITIYDRPGGPDRGIRMRQRSHVVSLPPATDAWITSDASADRHPTVALMTVLEEQSWAADTQLVRPNAQRNGARRLTSFERAGGHRQFKPRDPGDVLGGAAFFYLVLFPSGAEWVEEDRVFFNEEEAYDAVELSKNTK